MQIGTVRRSKFEHWMRGKERKREREGRVGGGLSTLLKGHGDPCSFVLLDKGFNQEGERETVPEGGVSSGEAAG